jgi:two-component system, NarL family, sensor kinase
MKTRYGFYSGILVLSLFLNLLSVRSSAQNIQQKQVSVLDSFRILDTLVDANKIANTKLAIAYAKRANVLAKKLGTAEELVRAEFLLGVAYFWTENKDTSYLYLTRAIQISDSLKSRHQVPKILYSMASINLAAQNNRTAVILLDSCIQLALKENDFSIIADAYNQLGNVLLIIRSVPDAVKMYDSALKIAREHKLYAQIGAALSNIAKFEKDPAKAIQLLKESVANFKMTKGTEAGIASSFGMIGNRQTNPDSALYYFSMALELVKNRNLSKVELFLYNNMAYSYMDKGNLDKATECLIQHAIPMAKKEKNHDWLSSLYDTYADVLSAQGKYEEALKWQKQSNRQRVAADQQQAGDQVRLLSSLLDLKNKEKEISDQRNRLQKVRFWLITSISLIIGFIFILLWLQQRNRTKLQKQQVSSAKRIIEMEESEKGRIAQELHDLTGQLVMGINGELEGLEIPDPALKDQMKGKIKELGQSIRRISHRMNRAMIEHFTFDELVSGQCSDFQRLTGIPVGLDISLDQPELPSEVVLHVYRILQELLTNAGKYVKEGQVTFEISSKGNQFRLYYSDNGPGFEPGDQKDLGMGLMNIYERTKILGGVAKLTSAPGDGTTWEILVPLQKVS